MSPGGRIDGMEMISKRKNSFSTLVSVTTITTTSDGYNTDNFSCYHWTATVVVKILKSFPHHYNTQDLSQTYNTSFDVGLSGDYTGTNVLYPCCLICNEMIESIDQKEEAQERKAIPRKPTEVSGAKESKGTE